MSKSAERASEAARAIYGAGDKVTSEAIDAWLRARDGVGCSMREASKAAREWRWMSQQRIEDRVEGIVETLRADTELRAWERIEVMRQLAKRRNGIGRVNP
jgi:hypothetical protein